MKIKLILLSCNIWIVMNLGAHEFWVDAKKKNIIEPKIGYGEIYPHPEKIKENRLDLFEPLKLLGNDTNLTLTKNSKVNYIYDLNKKLKNGSYILSGTYKPTYWTKDEEGKWFKGKAKNQIDTKAVFCQQSHMEAKNIFSIGNIDSEIIYKPIGHTLEIVPLSNPKDFKSLKPFKVKVFFNNKPLSNTVVKATLEGYLEDKYAYYGETNEKGITEILPLRGGKWLVKVVLEKELKDKNICDKVTNVATLSFEIEE
ncbi:DUF4198 domain-containing protein [Arcobacter sp. F2176]|uniref:DUF4198 domain-containing protein n=1 Tax=Arcobacter sp. F2176 TaxID=2044511 RepID=UPI0013E99D38|nr:DUF4198 domain-containing protein [Arcobacter sp. F2176]